MSDGTNPFLLDASLRRRLFWDCDPARLDLEGQADFILGRCLEYGTLETARWCLRRYGGGRMAGFLRGRGMAVLSRKTILFWAQILGLEGEECFRTSSLASKRAFWNY